jgi:hypothetical protein
MVRWGSVSMQPHRADITARGYPLNPPLDHQH